jgi:hypothetical protein
MLTGRAEPAGDQHCAELVTVQAGGMGFIIQARAADMNRRGLIEEIFFHGVLVEACDGA